MKFLIALMCLSFSVSTFATATYEDQLKDEIMSIARKNAGKEDIDGHLQQEIEVKVQELEKVLPYETMQEKAGKVLGPWKQVFGPYSATGDGKIPTGTDPSNIYQIIMPDGIFYNVALFKLSGLKGIFLLKGTYQVTDEAIEGKFVRNDLLVRNIPNIPLYQLPAALERGNLRTVKFPGWIPPVGQGGKLLEVYTDGKLRILRGLTPSFKRPALYIMERMP